MPLLNLDPLVPDLARYRIQAPPGEVPAATYADLRVEALGSIARDAAELERNQSGVYQAYSEAAQGVRAAHVRPFVEANKAATKEATLVANNIYGALANGLVFEDTASVHAFERATLEHIDGLEREVPSLDPDGLYNAFKRMGGNKAAHWHYNVETGTRIFYKAINSLGLSVLGGRVSYLALSGGRILGDRATTSIAGLMFFSHLAWVLSDDVPKYKLPQSLPPQLRAA